MGAGPTATTSITVTLFASVGAGPFTLTIPAVAAANTAIGAADQLVRNIFVRGGFWASNGNFYPTSTIQSIAST
jgi:hypothetical protein